MSNSIKAYLVGSGIGSLSAAAFMIRDAGVEGHNITIFEAMPLAGGSLDGGGNADTGYTLRGGRMLTTDNYECTWDLFKSIPSLEHEGQSVYDETVAFNKMHKSHAQARLVDSAPPKLDKRDSQGWALWEKLAVDRPQFGNPAAFNSSIPESWWESFTVTLKDTAFFDKMEQFSGNAAGTGGLVTFKDSNWLMSIVLAHQPHFAGQPEGVQVFWGYALHPDRVGDFVAKPMADCTGEEILRELCGHLNFDMEIMAKANCIPCRMPYITSMFMPRFKSDRPLPVPSNSRNLAFVSQFVEVPEDVVFTVEYSVRAAQMAVYQLLDVKREVPPVSHHDQSMKVKLDALVKAFR